MLREPGVIYSHGASFPLLLCAFLVELSNVFLFFFFFLTGHTKKSLAVGYNEKRLRMMQEKNNTLV